MTEDKDDKRTRVSRREFDIMNRMTSRDARSKPKYGLNRSFTPLELETLNKWRRFMRDAGDTYDKIYSCAICGKAWPEWFFIPSEEWARHVPAELRKAEICRECYDEIKAAADREDTHQD